MSFTLTLDKEYFKFSAAHFTIFDKGSAERLHGHNYLLAVSLDYDSLDEKTEISVEFKKLKDVIKKHCDLLDEKVLVPKDSSFLEISASKHYENHTEVLFGEKHYVLPNEDLLLLPLANITSEALARYLWVQLKEDLPSAESLVTTITETDGQSVSYCPN